MRGRHAFFLSVGLCIASWVEGCDQDDPAGPAPLEFSGIGTAFSNTPGSAVLGWEAATGGIPPVEYDGWVAFVSSGQDFAAAPLVSTTALEIEVAGLPTDGSTAYFVVRARDAGGEHDENRVQAAVIPVGNGLTLLGRYATEIASDIAVSEDGQTVAMGGFITAPQVHAWVFDVSDPANPVLKTTLFGTGRATDVEIRDGVLWVSTEDDTSAPPSGAYAYDIHDVDSIPSVPIGKVTGHGVEECHTIWIDGTNLYCASTDDGLIHLVDITDPATPANVSSFGIPGAHIHDMYASGTQVIGAFLGQGFAFIDWSNPTDPVLQHRVVYEDAFSHNVWPNVTGEYLFTTDENTNGHLRIWDIRNLAAVTQVAEFIIDAPSAHHAIVHNVQVVGQFAYVSWYEAGVAVLDVSVPEIPVLVGLYDTWPEPTAGTFAGAWGVAPHPPYVYVSNFNDGLFTFRFDAPPGQL